MKPVLTHRRRLLAGAAASAVAALVGSARASEPADEIVLFEGKTRDAAPRRLAMSEIRKLPRATLITHTPWFDGATRFEGPLARDLIAYVGGHGDTLSIEGLDGYAIKAPVADFDTYDARLAYRIDGRDLTVETKGPLMLIYPFDTTPAIANEGFYARCVWQIAKFDIE